MISLIEAVEMRRSVQKFIASEAGIQFMTTYAKASQESAERLVSDTSDGFGTQGAIAFINTMSPKLPLFWVDPTMCELVEAAASSMPDEPPLVTDPPCPAGCVIVSRPMIRYEGDMDFRWMGFCWLSISHQRNEELIHGKYNPNQVHGFALVGLCDPGSFPDCPAGLPPIIPGPQDGISLGSRPIGDLQLSAQSPDDLWRRQWPRAFWTISKQLLTRVSNAKLPRCLARRCEKDGEIMPDVRIVTLRKLSHGSRHGEEISEIAWSHRWIVGGHWRNQWLPSIKAHRLQWIAPHIKGPDNKPLRIKETIGALVR